MIGASLINELDNLPRNFILVLDDYHVIRNQVTHDIMTQILRQVPQPLQLVLSTRHDPPLRLAGLRARTRRRTTRRRFELGVTQLTVYTAVGLR